MNVKFKVGDLVYCPTLSSALCKIKESGCICEIDSNIAIYTLNQCGLEYKSATGDELVFTTEDRSGYYSFAHCPIIHATAENYALLTQLYGEFEAPIKGVSDD